MMESAPPIPGVLGEHPDRCVQAQRGNAETVESAFSPGLQTPAAGSLVEDAAGEVVCSPLIPRWRTRVRAKWEISVQTISSLWTSPHKGPSWR